MAQGGATLEPYLVGRRGLGGGTNLLILAVMCLSEGWPRDLEPRMLVAWLDGSRTSRVDPWSCSAVVTGWRARRL